MALVITCLRGKFDINLPSSLFWNFEISRVKHVRACNMWLTRNHMFIREIWGKFTSFIFWNFEISLVLLGKFQNFKNVNSVHLSQISLLNMWLLVLIKVDIRMFLEWENNSRKLQIISGKFQNSGEFQNNAINDVKQISLNHVINWVIFLFWLKWLDANPESCWISKM